MQNAIELDTRGLHRPINILRIRKLLQKMYPGQLLRVIATDPESANDLTAYCAHTGDRLLESRLDGNKIFHTIKKRPQT